ncbi:MAG TPA: GNAT family N-acetyltransferase [bacterium]|jgi:GNAT superfamily N-acetyltransferase
MPISIAITEAQIRRAFPVMQQLRPHLDEEGFVQQVMRQQERFGYVLAVNESEGIVRAVAGFRIGEFLAWGKILYVDDLVADEAVQGGGYANQLFDWLVDFARRQNCQQLHLDSGANPGRYRAHRFYHMKGMNITSHHFALDLTQQRKP